ncbi:MAG: small ribosomal subunit biogenesis GTPase RsgA [Gammaproteobacteria bacterium]|nr:small ribosomal subunit biogenesis GTPase RsgA [Gammaproteobacteria bacterium]
MARRLTQKQQRRIKTNQQQQLEQHDDIHADTTGITGRVITNFGKTAIVEIENNELVRCHPRQNIEQIVCGDNVIIQKLENQDAVVTAILKRTTLLKKPGFGGKLKPMAANIDQVVIVMAIKPVPNLYLIDRYLVATENLQARALIIINKTDLADDDTDLNSLLNEYRELGYKVLPTSTTDSLSTTALKAELNKRTSIMVGLSGVGKSSLINTLLPQQDIRVGEVSAASGEGTHTTTSSMLYHLPDGGDIIDSPGVRDFGLWNTSVDDVLYGFKEIRDLAGQCKFSNCKHEVEPGCVINQAVDKGLISRIRFNSYKKIIQEYT